MTWRVTPIRHVIRGPNLSVSLPTKGPKTKAQPDCKLEVRAAWEVVICPAKVTFRSDGSQEVEEERGKSRRASDEEVKTQDWDSSTNTVAGLRIIEHRVSS